MSTRKLFAVVTYAILLNFILFVGVALAAAHYFSSHQLAQQFIDQFHQAVIAGVKAGK